jgi:hypothetical protein
MPLFSLLVVAAFSPSPTAALNLAIIRSRNWFEGTNYPCKGRITPTIAVQSVESDGPESPGEGHHVRANPKTDGIDRAGCYYAPRVVR